MADKFSFCEGTSIGRDFIVLFYKPDQTWQSLFTAFPGDSFTSSFRTVSQATVLPFSQPDGHYMYRTLVTICTAQWSPYVPHSGNYMYRTVVTICTTRCNIQQFHVLSTQCIYVFCVDLRTNSDYFPIQH